MQVQEFLAEYVFVTAFVLVRVYLYNCMSVCDSLGDANICCGSLVKHFRGVVGVLTSEQLSRRVANWSQTG